MDKRYSEEELKEFEQIIFQKIEETTKELNNIKLSLGKVKDNGTDSTFGKVKGLEGGADTLEKENLGQQAVRLKKFKSSLENALIRINNGTYGICVSTGKLISKERLKLVPHTTHSVYAKKHSL